MRTAFAGLLSLIAAMLMVACGGDEEADYSDDGRGGTPSDTTQTVALTTSDFSFAPTELSGKTGEPMELRLTNDGNAPHTFTIDELDVDTEVAAGEETTISFTLSAAGDFSYYCRFHRDQGMEGDITVSGVGGAADPGPTESPVDDPYFDY
jgi:plastocyanin